MTAIELQRGDFYFRTERRIGWLTLCTGVLGAFLAWRIASPHAAGGIAVGAALAWLNFHWIERGTAQLVKIANGPAADGEKRAPRAGLVLMIVRYGLIALAAYVIVISFKVPIWSILSGLLALGAAAIVASLYGVLFDNN